MIISPLAGHPAPCEILVDVPRLVSAYFTNMPDPGVPAECVAFGTSGHRGTSLSSSFNEHHVLAITQAICEYRAAQHITGPVFIGIDTHALSVPACASAVEVFAANGVDVLLAPDDEPTPTPAVSLAILHFNRQRRFGLADGVVITPSHNPPEYGGFKYNPPHGGPAETVITEAIQLRANALLTANLSGVRRMPFPKARLAPTTQRYDFMGNYVNQLDQVIDFDVIRGAGLRIGVDPMGGAGVHYWHRIGTTFQLNLQVVSELVDPTFRFMSLDWDGKIRMDPSSSYAMQRLIGLRQDYDIAFACDTDHDRHGIVTPSAGLQETNHYLSVAINYLFAHRPDWPLNAGIGTTVVTTQMLARVGARLGRKLLDMPVGFKWFVAGLRNGTLGFAGEESAGATFLRRNGTPWTTDKDGMVAGLLAAEMTARTGRDPAQEYQRMAAQLGTPVSRRDEAAATPEQKIKLAALSADQVTSSQLAGQPITGIITRASGNDAPIGGIKVSSRDGWFAARPSGTEALYKIYAESFSGEDHLEAIIREARQIVEAAIG